jgi:hypothetical protein
MARFTAIASLIAVGGLLVAAAGCSSSSGNSADSTGTNTGSVSSEGGRSPIKLMVIGDFQSAALSLPEMIPGGQAGVNEVNAAGGVDGHRLELLTCNSQADPNATAACAREAVSENVAAVVGKITIQSDAGMSILAAAQIPSIGGVDIGTLDHTSPDSFPIASGPMGAIAQVLTLPSYQRCRHPVVDLLGTPINSVNFQNIKGVFGQLRPPITPASVLVSATTTDFQPTVAAVLAGGTDCVFGSGTPSTDISIAEGVNQANKSVKFMFQMNSAPIGSLLQVKDSVQGVYGSSPFILPGASAAADRFASEMKEIAPSASDDVDAEGVYAGVLIFAAVAKQTHLTNFSGPSVLAAMYKARNIDIGVTAPIASFPANSGVPGLPRDNFTKYYGYVFEGDQWKEITSTPVNILPVTRKLK